jgi:hypothetical protein
VEIECNKYFLFFFLSIFLLSYSVHASRGEEESEVNSAILVKAPSLSSKQVIELIRRGATTIQCQRITDYQGIVPENVTKVMFSSFIHSLRSQRNPYPEPSNPAQFKVLRIGNYLYDQGLSNFIIDIRTYMIRHSLEAIFPNSLIDIVVGYYVNLHMQKNGDKRRSKAIVLKGPTAHPNFLNDLIKYMAQIKREGQVPRRLQAKSPQNNIILCNIFITDRVKANAIPMLFKYFNRVIIEEGINFEEGSIVSQKAEILRFLIQGNNTRRTLNIKGKIYGLRERSIMRGWLKVYNCILRVGGNVDQIERIDRFQLNW